MDFLLGQTNAVIIENESGFGTVVEFYGDCAAEIGVECAPGLDCVGGVLQQFAQVNLGPAVKVKREQFDDSAQIHLKGVRLFLH